MKPIMMMKFSSCVLVAWFMAISTQAFCSGHNSIPHNFGGDEDTILIEKQEGSKKIPYGLIARKLGQHFFNFDARDLVTFSLKPERRIARSFTDYLERSKYRVDMRKDKFELKYSLNF